MAKGRKTGGRTAGTPNKRTVAEETMRDEALSKGKSPLKFLLDIQNKARPPKGIKPETWWKMRADAAKAAAPYVHARLITQKVELGGHGGGPLETKHTGGVLLVPAEMTLEEWSAKYGSGLDPVHDVEVDEDAA
jgi:hypothetical protein